MSSDHLVANYQTGEFGENRKICVVDHVNGLQHSITESDSFVVDMERFSHLIDKDSNPANSRIAVSESFRHFLFFVFFFFFFLQKKKRKAEAVLIGKFVKFTIF